MRVFSARMFDQLKTQSQSLQLILYTIPLEASSSIFSLGFWSMLEMERIGLGATLMLKLQINFVTLSENRAWLSCENL